ncbi:MAG: hypothetical protein KDA89_12965 [Planctomycetaceae bacterium]|nr:hypothetical protein [Planctomycetaceae bacterium]
MKISATIACVLGLCFPVSAGELTVAVFDINVTPPVGTEMAYDPVKRVDELTLRCRGIVLSGNDEPMVLCAVDWIGIANEGHDAFRTALASAAGTQPERVAVHTLHQHDAPACDFTAESLLRDAGCPEEELGRYNGTFARSVLEQLSESVKESLKHAQPVTHVGFGAADVRKVASNRRIMGPDGKVRAVRYTATRSKELQDEPEGVIDPQVSLLSFWNGEKPVAVLSYYACHPQSYYRTGIPSPDFPGIARFFRQQSVPSAVHIHFDGAGGNIGAGKYNDGSPPNRVVLASRLADGMREAWESTQKTTVSAADIAWNSEAVALPPARHLNEADLQAALNDRSNPDAARAAADKLAWLRRCQAGHRINISMLTVAGNRVLHLPGELFVEYQLAAKKLRPDLNVMMAAYGDYGPGYIGTEVAYSEGGYETSDRASDVAPEVEQVLMSAIESLLQKTRAE